MIHISAELPSINQISANQEEVEVDVLSLRDFLYCDLGKLVSKMITKKRGMLSLGLLSRLIQIFTDSESCLAA